MVEVLSHCCGSQLRPMCQETARCCPRNGPLRWRAGVVAQTISFRQSHVSLHENSSLLLALLCNTTTWASTVDSTDTTVDSMLRRGTSIAQRCCCGSIAGFGGVWMYTCALCPTQDSFWEAVLRFICWSRVGSSRVQSVAARGLRAKRTSSRVNASELK